MSRRQPIVWLLIVAMSLARTSTFGQSHEQGVNAGRNANTVIKGLVKEPSARSVVPGYTTSPAETALANKPNLGADANARLIACALRPDDHTCLGTLNALNSANTPRAAISAADPAVADASRIARNPSTAIGSLADYYSGCVTADVSSPPRMETRTCTRHNGIGSFTCSNRLTVGIARTPTCEPGAWFAHAATGAIGLDAQCLPDRPTTRQHFRITASGSPLAFFDVDMTVPVVSPQFIAAIGSSYSWMTGNEIRRGVWVADKSCTGDSCSLTAMVADEFREECSGSPESGLNCTTTYPFVSTHAACVAGRQSGDNIQDTVCQGENGCNTTTLEGTKCYAPSSVRTPLTGTDVTGSLSGNYWTVAGNRPASGWALNPAFGAIPTVRLGYARPSTTIEARDVWSDNCPPVAAGGRCNSPSVARCVDGPATRSVDGTEVTRDCWEYQSAVSCANEAAADQCAPLIAGGCTAVSSTCTQSNQATGACEISQDQYACPLPAETVTTAGNCPRDVFCIGTSCFNTAHANDADFARAMSMLEAAREAGVYIDSDRMQVFKGEANRCRDKLLKNCCYTDGAGRGMNNHGVFGVGTRLVFDILTNSQNREFVVQGMNALLTSAGFSGSFSTYGFTVAVNGTALPAGSTALYSSSALAGEGVVVAYDPWSLAISAIVYVVFAMLECNDEEARLALKEGATLCHSVGTHCSSCLRILGACVSCIERTTAKCCFNSVLARIVNEQGRMQVGKSWGGSRNPDCSGFTVAQLQSLDFAAMDLSEFYASLVPTSPNVATLQTNSASRVPACYYGQGRCQ